MTQNIIVDGSQVRLDPDKFCNVFSENGEYDYKQILKGLTQIQHLDTNVRECMRDVVIISPDGYKAQLDLIKIREVVIDVVFLQTVFDLKSPNPQNSYRNNQKPTIYQILRQDKRSLEIVKDPTQALDRIKRLFESFKNSIETYSQFPGITKECLEKWKELHLRIDVQLLTLQMFNLRIQNCNNSLGIEVI